MIQDRLSTDVNQIGGGAERIVRPTPDAVFTRSPGARRARFGLRRDRTRLPFTSRNIHMNSAQLTSCYMGA